MISLNVPKHPNSEGKASVFHLVLGVYYALGLYFHVVSAWRHFRDS